MKKTLITRIVFVVGIILLLILQLMWSYSTYKNVSKTLVDNVVTCLDKAVNYEVMNRPIKVKIRFQFKKMDMRTVDPKFIYNLNTSSEFNIALNDIYREEGSPMNIKVVDSLFVNFIKADYGSVPEHTISRVNGTRMYQLEKQKLRVVVSKNGQIIEQKTGTDEWIVLKLMRPQSSVFQKAKILFLSSVLIVLIIAFVIIIQFRNMQHDRKFVKFLVDYTRMLAHDLKTPIAGAQMLVSNAIRKTSLPEDPKKVMLEQSIDLMGKTLLNLDVLLYLAKSEHATIPVNKIPVNLNKFIDAIVHTFTSRDYAPKQVSVECVIPESLVAMIDKVLIENVLINVIDNSIKYSGMETVIQIRAEVQSNELILRIIDNGYGISLENQKKVFDIFERGDAEGQPALPGFGLGLHFVQKAVQAHDGKVFVKSEIGKGTEFSIVLPLEN